MARAVSTAERSHTDTIVTAAIVVAALHFGRDILLPFALAILLSFSLAPVVERLEKWLGRIPSVLAVVSVAFVGIAIVGALLVQPVYDLAYRLPDYKENIVAKVQTFQGDGTGIIDRVSKTLDDMRARLTAGLGNPPAGPSQGTQKEGSQQTEPEPSDEHERPVPVEVVETLSVREIAQGILGPLVSPLASAAMVIIFVIFMLLKREDLRNRLIHLIGGEQLNVTTEALDDAASRVSRYLLMQLLINSCYGLVICIGLSLIGLPNALLWGALTAVLRFVPYIGPWIAALMPIAISLAVFDGWLRPALVLALFIVNELVSNNFVEPWLYGSSTGISTIGILASAVFWAWIWGPVGLVMATPLTVCLTTVGKYVPQLAFLNTMLSDEDVLPPHARFYQRLLAMDPEESLEVAEDHLQSGSLEEAYDTVLLPALALAERDRHHGDLDEAKQQFVNQTTREIVEEFGERTIKASHEKETPPDAPTITQRASILCLPARDEADELAGLMLAQLLKKRGVNMQVASTQTLSGEMVGQIEEESISIVCISALPPLAVTHARYLCKRLRPKFPHLKLIVGIWQEHPITKKSQERLSATGIDKLVNSLSDAATELERLSQATVIDPHEPPLSS